MLDKFRFTFFFLILMFSYSNFIIYDFFTLSYNPDSGIEFIPNSVNDFGIKLHILDLLHSIIFNDKIYRWKHKIKKKECKAEYA
jgi:hypothetical protein